jgi:hypothetical protein
MRSRPAIPTGCAALFRTTGDHDTQQRRPFMRFFAYEQDFFLNPPDAPLPDAVASGQEPLIVVGRSREDRFLVRKRITFSM